MVFSTQAGVVIMMTRALCLYSSLVAAILLSGCASYPSSIAISDPQHQPKFAELLASPEQNQGKTLVMGGQVVSISNANNSTLLEILQMPLWETGKPRTDRDLVGGRMRARVPYFLDPEVYAKGRLVSVRGVFSGLEDGTIGEHPYQYPTLDVTGIQLWPKDQDPEVVYLMNYGFWGPGPAPGSRIMINTQIPPRR
jgi:outer membrane lipoprotein